MVECICQGVGLGGGCEICLPTTQDVNGYDVKICIIIHMKNKIVFKSKKNQLYINMWVALCFSERDNIGDSWKFI